MENITVTSLRENLYKIIDRVIVSGVPQKFVRKGKKLKIMLDEKANKLDNLVPHNTIVGDPEDILKAKPYKWTEPKNL